MNEPKKRLTTTQLLSLIKRSRRFAVVDEALEKMDQAPDFCQYLYRIMEERQINAKEVIRRSGIERSYFYHILSGQKTPSRNMLLRISRCIGASLDETNQLLRLAALGSLYARVRRDAGIIFCIENGYTMRQTNEFLKELHEAPLYQDE